MAQRDIDAIDSPVQVDGITFEDFLKQYDGVRAEWIMGKVEIQVTNNTAHQEILGFLYTLFRAFFAIKPIGRVLLAGVVMYLGKDKPAREPDIMIVLNDHIDRIQPTRLNGTADIVVEIVSPESSNRDRGTKFDEYEAAGIPEYWLFDPLRKEAHIYALTEVIEDGEALNRYRLVDLDADGQLVSTLLVGFALDPAILWLEELPDSVKTLEMVQSMIAQ